MPAKAMYLVRTPDGRMRTVVAFSPRGAVKLIAAKGFTGRMSVKERGAGEWEDYTIRSKK